MSDAYGGSREKRARFLLDLVQAVAAVCGGTRIGVRLSPLSPVNDLALDSVMRANDCDWFSSVKVAMTRGRQSAI